MNYLFRTPSSVYLYIVQIGNFPQISGCGGFMGNGDLWGLIVFHKSTWAFIEIYGGLWIGRARILYIPMQIYGRKLIPINPHNR